MYRRVRNLFENTYVYTLLYYLQIVLLHYRCDFSKSLKKFDPFAKQKKDSFTQSLSAIVSLSEYLLPLLQNPNGVDVKAEFLRLLKVVFNYATIAERLRINNLLILVKSLG